MRRASRTNGAGRAAALAAAMGLALHGPLWALSSDREQPIHLDADRAELNNATGNSVYTGDVVLTQGTMKITGDVLRVFTNDQREVARIEVEGSPATYRQLPDGEEQYVRARAPRMEYYAGGPERIRLLNGATLWQGRNEFKGETIVYEVASEQVRAEGKGGDERISITLFPNQGEADDGEEDGQSE